MTNTYKPLFARLLLIILAVAGSFYAFMVHLPYTACFLILVFVLLLVELFSFMNNAFLFYDKTISAILNNDFSSDFSRYDRQGSYRELFKLYNTLKDRQYEQFTKELVYRSILNNIETGVVILKRNEADGEIFLMNDYFSGLFEVPKVSRWNYLKKHLPALCNIIEEQNFTDLRTSVQIKVGNSESQAFMLQTSTTMAFGSTYYIILLDSIQSVVAKKEKDAWINLMKVISHELMNSITPIRSLTQNLNEMAAQEAFTKDDIQDMRQSLSTMIHRSNHLQNFIESYRTLAMLPLPVKTPTEIGQLVENVLSAMAPVLKTNTIKVQNAITLHQVVLLDEQQMEQVFINLITNSIYALDGRPDKQVSLSAEVRANRLFITITDNGLGIDKEIEDKIFMPFFTTRKQGAGIGLTLSKNIIEGHGGYLNYSTEGNTTSFTICLLL
ncbi:histidine kinase [Flavobacterium akiainvivens]|uniref:histidine kinase n=1 Tax=Flavobacterium akiainvivens TaxID=1202724 RepID=A0A0M8MHB2_9FLAO|nr:HAMP domain-containing sensor histidine kinase [Flavobacterium akiainvivens]KOS05598.1 histidine kinase [Flavobacterium akiainvivens]SFQ35076.1 Histidine kinase-, DNA gyrase B-, and HSP90-like ATPase [Flavobacterium akiainvivens]